MGFFRTNAENDSNLAPISLFEWLCKLWLCNLGLGLRPLLGLRGLLEVHQLSLGGEMSDFIHQVHRTNKGSVHTNDWKLLILPKKIINSVNSLLYIILFIVYLLAFLWQRIAAEVGQRRWRPNPDLTIRAQTWFNEMFLQSETVWWNVRSCDESQEIHR